MSSLPEDSNLTRKGDPTKVPARRFFADAELRLL
jgi:hypothetical protein